MRCYPSSRSTEVTRILRAQLLEAVKEKRIAEANLKLLEKNIETLEHLYYDD